MRAGLGLALAVLLPVCALVAAPAARAQTGLQVVEAPAPEVVFGESATFRLAARGEAVISGVSLNVRAGLGPPIILRPEPFEPGREVEAVVRLDLTLIPLPAFSAIDYWWTVTDAEGGELTTEPAVFYYDDERFEWQRLTEGALTVHWYSGDVAFGQAALQTATDALTRANRDIRAPLPEHTDIYIYATEGDVRAALRRVGRVWANGHADPEAGAVFVVVADGLGADVSLAREIPHELTHVLLYRATGEHYARVPAWLNEGLASLNQAQPEPNQAATFAAARDAGQFHRLASLCGTFPADAGRAAVAYAQSASLVEHVRAEYGSEGLHRLVQAYAGGAGCQDGVEMALGLSLDALEQQWLAAAVETDTVTPRWQALAPWVLFSGLVLLGLAALWVLAASTPAPTRMV